MATAAGCYAQILGQVFPGFVPTFDPAGSASNNIIGALNHVQFGTFRQSFLSRLSRLARVYPVGHASRPKLFETLNEVASERNWAGAYAELVAYDFLNSTPDWLDAPIELSRTVPAAHTLASSLGGSSANYDGYLADFGVCFDVKILSDKSRALLEGIIADAIQNAGVAPLRIAPEYPLDEDYRVFERARRSLVEELAAELKASATSTLVYSKVVSSLSYRIDRGKGTLITLSEHHPFRHALNHHPLLFAHAKKFSRVEPSLIVFVLHPWFSERALRGIGDNEQFFRAFCRRFFCQYVKDARPARQLIPRFSGPETLADVTALLSGVLFLEDEGVTAKDPAAQNIRPWVYLNPNAAHPVSRHFIHFLDALHFRGSDFSFDNY